MEKPMTIRGMLKAQKKRREHLFEKFIIRLGWFRSVAEKDGSKWLLCFIREVEEHRTFEILFRSLLNKRSGEVEAPTAESARRYTPLDRPSKCITDRLSEGLRDHIFKPN